MKILIIVITVMISGLAFCEDHHDHSNHEEKDNSHSDDDHESSKKIGRGKAIEQIDQIKGFKLSKEAIKTLDLKFKSLNEAQNTFEIRKATLVTSKEVKGVYRYRSSFFKLLKVRILEETKLGYKVEVKEVKHGDQIVIGSVGLLRIADIYSTDEAEYEHAH